MTMADAITTVSEKIIWLLIAPKAGRYGLRASVGIVLTSGK
jgi:hypothetical protein